MEPTIKPTKKQYLAWEKLLDDSTKYVVFGGGAGGGKSWMGCEWILSNCFNYPGSKWFIGREELKRLMSSSYITWNKVCKHHNYPSSDWKYNGQYNYIEFKNGSRVDLLDLKYLPSDPMYERFGSLEYTGGWIEEAGEVDFEAFDVLKSRINRHMNDEYGTGKILLTCNPNKGWLYSVVYRPHRAGKLDPSYAFIQSLYKDNPHTAESYEASLKDIKSEATKQRLMFGNWEYDDDPGKLIDYDAIRDMFTNKTGTGTKCLTIDVARYGRDLAVIMYWEGMQVKNIYTFDRTSIDFLIEQSKSICDANNIPRSSVIADEDGVGGGFVDMFRCKGFVGNRAAVQTELAKTTKEKNNFANLRTQCYYMLADKINRRKIGIDSQAYEEKISRELEQIKEKNIDKDTKLQIVPKEQIKEAIGHSPDFADSLMMRMWFELPGHSLSSPYKKTFKIEYDEYGTPMMRKRDESLRTFNLPL